MKKYFLKICEWCIKCNW